MPHLRLECIDYATAEVLMENFSQIESALVEASHKSLGYPRDQFVVLVPRPLLMASSNAEKLVIYPYASEREPLVGKEVEWRDAIALAWDKLLEDPALGELAKKIPSSSCAVWPEIADGARWGLVSTIVAEHRSTAG